MVATGRNIGSLNVLVESEDVRRRESENRNQLLDEMSRLTTIDVITEIPTSHTYEPTLLEEAT